MNHLKSLLILTVILTSQLLFSQSKPDSLYKNAHDTVNYKKMIDSMMNVYSKQNETYKKQMDQQNKNQRGAGNKYFGVTIDLIAGLGFSKTSYNLSRDTSGLGNPNAKTGPMIGANINLRLIGFSLGTGFNYSSKGFTTSNSNTHNANYINIPLMFSYNFNIKKAEMDISAGPYVGILLSQDQSQLYALKNIDIGITGLLQGNYFFNKFLGLLLGVKYEQGGLNNLLKTNGVNNNYISSIKTTNWFVYTGMKFIL